jgi:murein DD-endopeptidase MepM/ murein hydrolase activator NlpD
MMARKTRSPGFWDGLFTDILPRTHLYAAAAVGLGVVLLLMVVPSENVSAYREDQLADIQVTDSGNRAAADLSVIAPDIAPEPASEPDVAETLAAEKTGPAAPILQWREQSVRLGDNLSTLFQRLSLSAGDVYRVANAAGEAGALKRLRPGETIAVAQNSDGELVQVEYRRSALETLVYSRTGEGFEGQRIARDTESVPAYQRVTINHSLFLDGSRAGLENELIMRVARIFGWDIDFALDIRKGDSFAVLYQEEYLDGAKMGNGAILAAEFINRGTRYRAVRYEKPDGSADFYTPEGRPMRKAFLRAPVDFTRVSSNFNPNRLHPVFKTKRPHRGVDYAAATGTPVYAAGDGKVIEAGYSRANGNYVFIRHGQAIVTKYLHLNSKSVRRGQTVKQRQPIGTVGSTGYATGPHLHYEFVVNGVHRNPRTVDLPEADPIPAAQMARFASQTQPLMAQLANYSETHLAALPE